MSIYTEESLTNAVYETLQARGVDVTALRVRSVNVGASLIPRIRTMIPAALELLSDRVKEGKDYQKGQKDFSITPVAGVIDLAAQPYVLFDFNKSTVTVAATGAYLEPVDDLWTLQNGDLPTSSTYYAEDGRTLRVRSTSGLLTDYVTPVKVRSNYVFSLTDTARPLPDHFDGALLATVVGMCIGKSSESMEAAA